MTREFNKIEGKEWDAEYLKTASKQDVMDIVARKKEISSVNGYTEDRSFRHIGQVPTHVYLKIEKLCPGFWKDINKVRKFFRLYDAFCTVEKV